ncbi:uncharacterized protein LOC142627844 [Castanea sativa]|uniref:uncharacterized protein LOC142627844 n=1 Tax=Castanea sativa TaxID=21020 RepID=UPI003F64C7C7
MVRSLRANFVRSLLTKPPDQPTPTSLRSLGKPPPWPDIKVNFDGACFQDEKLAGTTAVIRARNGQVLATMVDRFPLPHSIVAVEVIVAIKALKFALELGHNSIILEGDSKIATKAMQSGIPTLADYGHLIEEVKMIAESFVSIALSFVPRQCNILAHKIARHVRHVSEYTVWIENVPPQLFTVIQAALAS